MGVALVACNKENENAVPKCIQEILYDFETNRACSEGATLEKFTFQTKTVYVFNPGFCGIDSSDIYDGECNYKGYLGGITMNETINNESFNNAISEGIIWKN